MSPSGTTPDTDDAAAIAQLDQDAAARRWSVPELPRFPLPAAGVVIYVGIRLLGLVVTVAEIRRAEDIAPAFAALTGRPQALYVVTEPLLTANRIQINTFALAARLATMYTFRDNVEAVGLMSYGPSL